MTRRKTRRVEFIAKNGLRLLLDVAEIEALLELSDETCQIVTGNDTYTIRCGYDKAIGRLWPDSEMKET